jgi:hypothetical protein
MATKETKTKIKNEGTRVYCVGEVNLIPGAEAKEIDTAYLDHFEIKDAIEKGFLVIPKEESDAVATKPAEEDAK